MLKRLLLKLLIVAALLYGYFVWPTPYTYGTWVSSRGYKYPMRTNRITRTVEIYYTVTGRWEDATDLMLKESEQPFVLNQ